MSLIPKILEATAIGAISWASGSQSNIRVYFQDNDNHIREAQWNGSSWSGRGSTDDRAIADQHSPIAVTQTNGAVMVRL